MGAIAHRLEILDPGFARSRKGVRAVGATVLAWATMVVVASLFDVADPLRITLFAAGAAFEGTLLAPDPRPADRIRTLGWAVVVAAVAVVATVYLRQTATWAAAGLLILLIYLSYALRPWSSRVASLALMGAITTYVGGAGYITPGRIGWFILALTIGFAWVAVWEALVLPDDPVRSANLAVHAFYRRAAESVTGVVDSLSNADDRDERSLQRSLDRVKACRRAVETQLPGAVVRGVDHDHAEQLRVALYSAQRGLEDMVGQARNPHWITTLSAETAESITGALCALATALKVGRDDVAPADVARRAQALRSHLHDELTPTNPTAASSITPVTLHSMLSLVGGGQRIAQSASQAGTLVVTAASEDLTGMPGVAPPPAAPGISPTTALAIQAVVAAVGAAVIARLVGNEQTLVVAWTAFVVIGGSAGASRHRAWARLAATVLGATAGVAVAATVPDTLWWTVAVVAVGVFFTVFSAPVSYPAMVFWMSIVFVPLFATQGLYLDLIRDKAVAALIGGGVAAVVALKVVPIRTSRDVRPAVAAYLEALNDVLLDHPTTAASARAEAELDKAKVALESILTTSADETRLFPQQGKPLGENGFRIEAVHAAYLRLAPLLSMPATGVDADLRLLRDLLADVLVSWNAPTPLAATSPTPVSDGRALEVADLKGCIADLAARVTELAATLNGATDQRNRR